MTYDEALRWMEQMVADLYTSLHPRVREHKDRIERGDHDTTETRDALTVRLAEAEERGYRDVNPVWNRIEVLGREVVSGCEAHDDRIRAETLAAVAEWLRGYGDREIEAIVPDFLAAEWGPKRG